ncbi:P-loop containing nucleoside triphosphate hydrolase protein [Amylocystis lapponica]|nr:P-loop containing nucleoside triphosphate hydrolase protein [Amylocystis lapponica]
MSRCDGGTRSCVTCRHKRVALDSHASCDRLTRPSILLSTRIPPLAMEVDSRPSGEPRSLLVGPSSASTNASRDPRDDGTTDDDMLVENQFMLGALLGGGGQSSHPPVEDPGVEDSLMGDDPGESFALGSLLGGGPQAEKPNDESFVPTGLLSGSTSHRHTQDSSIPGSSFSQSQDDEFPSVADLLRPYAAASTALGLSSSGSTSSSIRTSTFDGKPVFLRRKPPRSNHTALREAAAAAATGTTAGAPTSRKFDKLLEVPIHRLLDELASTTAAKLDKVDRPAAAPAEVTAQPDATLWFDRYRPKRFTELLGDDRVHREVTAWVKEWDWCVFGARKGRGRKRPLLEDGENTDEWRRPQEKLLLLSGPPGMGKTTLAHVVAQHAGYSVFEVNASDARTATNFDQRVRPALESGYAIGSTKPIMVVIDEIDGATGGTDNTAGFVQKLIQLTFDRPKKKGRKVNPQASRPLLRPIICICNDLYANALAKLRPHARIVRCGRPNDMNLVRRLRHICESEGARVEPRALTTLVGVAQGDMRACLNALQMIAKKGGDVSEATVRRETADIKQADTSQLAVLNDLFAPMARKRAKDLGLGEEEEARYVVRLSREVDASAAYDRIAVGCFEHYANLHRFDANFARYLRAHEWLAVYDGMAGAMYAELEFELMQYLAYPLVAFYPLFQERGGPRVERPHVDYENHVQTKMNQEIYQSLAHCLRGASLRGGGHTRHLASARTLQLEVAPLLNRIISPPLQPVNSQIIRPAERAQLSRLVDIMVSLELRFVQERAEDGQLVYRLDPPIDVFVTYDGKRALDIAASRYALRHLVAAEIEGKLAARHGSTEKTPASSNFFVINSARKRDEEEPVEGDDSGNGPDAEPAVTSNKRARLHGPSAAEKTSATLFGLPVVPRPRQKEVDPADKTAVDFFGRPIVAPSGQKPVSTKTVTPYRVTYRFREGNSAAVRKPVKVGAFL